MIDVSSRYAVDPENPAWASIAAIGALALLPEGRGYGGSEGPSPLDAARGGMDTTFDMLLGRASDANAAAGWAGTRPDVDGVHCAIAGARRYYDERRFRPLQRWRDYPGTPGIEGPQHL